jgi:hypothetical protein
MFVIGVAPWCVAGVWLVSHHKITQAIERWPVDRPGRVHPDRPLHFPKAGILGFRNGHTPLAGYTPADRETRGPV